MKTSLDEEKAIKLQIWDTAGQERFRALIPSYIRDSSVVVAAYDVTNRTTFANIDRWIEQIRDIREENVIIFLVGNKTDLVEQRVVSFEEGEARAEELCVTYFETSAKTGTNITSMFKKIAEKLPEPRDVNLP